MLDIKLIDKEVVAENTPWLLKAVKESTVIKVLSLSIPFIFAGYLTYWKFGSRRFTFSEYVIAGLYLLITVRIYIFLSTPINYLFFNSDELSDFRIAIIFLAGVLFGSITVIKAFPIKPVWKSLLVFIGFFALASLFYFIQTVFLFYIDDVLTGADMENWFENFFAE